MDYSPDEDARRRMFMHLLWNMVHSGIAELTTCGIRIDCLKVNEFTFEDCLLGLSDNFVFTTDKPFIFRTLLSDLLFSCSFTIDPHDDWHFIHQTFNRTNLTITKHVKAYVLLLRGRKPPIANQPPSMKEEPVLLVSSTVGDTVTYNELGVLDCSMQEFVNELQANPTRV
jgi:hypothetical protein